MRDLTRTLQPVSLHSYSNQAWYWVVKPSGFFGHPWTPVDQVVFLDKISNHSPFFREK